MSRAELSARMMRAICEKDDTALAASIKESRATNGEGYGERVDGIEDAKLSAVYSRMLKKRMGPKLQRGIRTAVRR